MPEIVFKEESYQECMSFEFNDQNIPFVAQSPLDLRYKRRPLTQKYIPDFICFGTIILELKAVHELANEHRAQVHNYLKSTGYKLGLLVNFGHHPQVEWEWVVR